MIGSPNTTNIMGYVYEDRNGNDAYDGDDVLIANREVWLQQGNCGQSGARLATVSSNSNGRYTVSGDFNGTYCVALKGDNGADDSSTVSVAAGQTMTNVDLRAAAPTAMISGWVWNDTPQPDGTPSGSEQYIPEAVVVVQRGECGSPLSVTVSAITDSQGHYYFRDLYSGTHCVTIHAYEGNNSSIFKNGNWSYPQNGIQQVTIRPGQEGIANFGWQYK